MKRGLLSSLSSIASLEIVNDISQDVEKNMPMEAKAATYKVGSRLTSVLASPDKPLMITRSFSGEGGAFYTTDHVAHKMVSSDHLSSDGYVPNGLRRIARGLRMVAYNADFDMYVKDIIREHGLPVDDTIDWAKWLDGTFYRVAPGNAEVKDEAIHHVIIENLLVRDALGNNFSNGQAIPGKMNDAIINGMSVDQQVTWYLKQMFKFRVSEAIDWVIKHINNRNRTTPMEHSTEEGETFNIIDLQDSARTNDKNENLDNLEYQAEIKEFTDAFFPWLKQTLGEDRGNRFAQLFTLLESSTDSEWDEVVAKFETEMDRSVNWLDKNILTLSKYIRQFFNETKFNPSSILVRLLNDYDARRLKKVKSKEQRNSESVQEPIPAKASSLRKETIMPSNKRESLREKLAKNRQASMKPKKARTVREILESKRTAAQPAPKRASVRTPLTNKKAATNKYAALVRIAAEEPEQFESALVELKEFYTEQAEKVDALLSNTVEPEVELPKEASVRVRLAAKRKNTNRFANLRRIAEETPEEFGEALVELYVGLDEGAEAIENLADNTGVELPMVDEDTFTEDDNSGE